MTTKKRSSFF